MTFASKSCSAILVLNFQPNNAEMWINYKWNNRVPLLKKKTNQNQKVILFNSKLFFYQNEKSDLNLYIKQKIYYNHGK